VARGKVKSMESDAFFQVPPASPGVEEEHEPRQKSSEARADRQHRQAGIRINGNGRRASASRRLPENCVKTASHEMLMSGG